MAHFAQLDQNNQVTQVIVLSNAAVGDEFPASELVGQSFIADILKLDGIWKQTSYNGNFRSSMQVLATPIPLSMMCSSHLNRIHRGH